MKSIQFTLYTRLSVNMTYLSLQKSLIGYTPIICVVMELKKKIPGNIITSRQTCEGNVTPISTALNIIIAPFNCNVD